MIIIFKSLWLASLAAYIIALNIDYSSKLEDLKTDVTMYESMVEGLILTNTEQHNMLLECMEGEKK